MTSASVGFHCPECARAGAQKVFTAASLGTRPLVTSALVAVNLVVFLVTRGGAGDSWQLGLLPIDPTRSADFGLFEPAIANGEWYRVFTSGFLHADLIHLGFNMAMLWVLGSQLEPAVGRLRFALLYAAGLVGGSFGVVLISQSALTVGASGAVFGLMGAAIAAQRANGTNPFDSGLGGLLMVNLIFTFAIPSVSIGGHLGGLAGGYLAGVTLWEFAPRNRSKWLAPLLMSTVTVGLFLVTLALSQPLPF